MIRPLINACRALGALVALAVGLTAAREFHAAPADDWFGDDPARATAQARAVDHWVQRVTQVPAGADLAAQEWRLRTLQFAALGHVQVMTVHPELAQELAPALERAIQALVSRPIRDIDQHVWGDDPIDGLAKPWGHGAYLGPLALVLSLQRALGPSPHEALHDRIVATLVRRLKASKKVLLLESYPRQLQVADTAAAAVAIILHAQLEEAQVPAVATRWMERLRSHFRDPETGLVYQSWNQGSNQPLDQPRATGTSLVSYYLSFVDPVLARELFEAVQEHLDGAALGFGMVREYLPSAGEKAVPDPDSGAIVLGRSLRATHLGLGLCRQHQRRQCFRERFTTVHIFGVPEQREGKLRLLTAGPAIDALTYAMTTTRRFPEHATAPPPSASGSAAAAPSGSAGPEAP